MLGRLVESESPYFVAEVTLFDDKPEKVNYASRRRAIEFYNRFVEVAFKGTIPPVNAALLRHKDFIFAWYRKLG